MTTDARAVAAKLMTERELSRCITELLRAFGFEHQYHTWLSVRSPRGFPDVIALNTARGIGVAFELKSEKGKVTLEQEAWLAAFAECGFRVALLRPSDWYAGRVEEMLR